MSNDQIEALLARDPFPPSSPDLDTIRRLGRRRRTSARLRVVGATVAVLLVAAGAWSVAGRGGDAQLVPAVTRPHHVTGLTSYERTVLRDIPGAYEVDGTVVLPATAHAGEELRMRNASRLVGTPVPLGFDGRAGPGYVPTKRTEKAYRDNAPKGSQVVVDPGPVWLACLAEKAKPCAPAVLVTADDGHKYFLFGIGTERFLQPGAPMELFLDDDYSDETWHESLIGGIDGTTISRVVVDLVDGSTAEATVDAGRLSPGNTLFWARLPAMPREVKAYDASGELVATHVVKKCSGGVDCEVR
jgi:hypothetical protein